MKVPSPFSSHHFEPAREHDSDAVSQFVAAGLISIAILIAGSSIPVGAAPGTGHRQHVYSVTAAGKAGAVRPDRHAEQPNQSALIYPGAIARAMNASLDIAAGAVEPVWDAALWISRQALAILADSGLDPSVANDGVLRGTRGNRAASAIAVALIGMLLFGMSGPLYYSWKMWRLGHIRRYR
ncbi:MAG: hypothetical protein Q7S58_13105 [Candidatus Binatus sp.]|uniref:hypothetical protein n=1 Tax=Candidatus Binatus sp. TaxID=2811406 RepID=UPI00272427F7|nr:hypothetical protein [Candidatus Binatus sp.]MDO8433337.1 hypothetical protein [Candidatus Binatus sp.]